MSENTPPDDPTLFRVFNEIGIIEQLSRNAFERVMPDGLKLSQFAVLNHFVRLGGARSPVELARAFQVTKGAMTNTVQKLEAKGFVETRPDPSDGRAKRVTLTQAGRTARNDAIRALGPQMRDFENRIDMTEIASLLPALTRLREILDQARSRPSTPVDKGQPVDK